MRETRVFGVLCCGFYFDFSHSGMATDVSQLERELNALKAQMNAIFAAAVDGLVLTDERGVIEVFNPAAEAIFDYSAQEVIGRNLGVLMPARYGLKHDGFIRRYLQTGERRIIGIGRELVGRRSDGSEFPMDLSVGTVNVNDRRIFIGIIRDLSSRKAIERALEEQRERLARVGRISTLGEMASAIAHEINQPLAAITTYASVGGRLIEGDRALDPERMNELFQKIEEQAKRASEVIRGVRGFVQNRESVHSSFTVDEAILSSVELFEIAWQRQRVKVDLEGVERGLVITAVRTQIEQVLVNLLHNAGEATAGMARDPRIMVRARADEDTARIEVEDNGPGVPEMAAEQLFEPFFTTKPDGTGLGLSISQSIMTAHKGTIHYEPGEWGGARFVLTLPLKAQIPVADEVM